MTAKKLILALVVAVVAIGAIFFVLPKDDTQTNTTDQSVNEAVQENPSDGGTGEQAGLPQYTTAQVAEHNSRTDCWTIINDSVYNLTSYISRHPGGSEIERACGIDGTSLFTQRETADGEEIGSGTPHSSSARQELARLKVGELSE